MYSIRVILTLSGMILFGASRGVAVKVFFQFGFSNPLFVTLIYLLGQTMSLVVHAISKRWLIGEYSAVGLSDGATAIEDVESREAEDIEYRNNNIELISVVEDNALSDGGAVDDTTTTTNGYSDREVSDYSSRTIVNDEHENEEGKDGITARPSQDDTESTGECNYEQQENGVHCLPDATVSISRTHRRRGSKTGLTLESERAVSWIHLVPWYLKPLIPGFFNLCNAALRWGALVYVAASTAEMLISGIELVFSVFAARFIRKRLISRMRWAGMSVVALGIILVGLADVVEEEEKASSDTSNNGLSPHDLLIGNCLIVSQCIFSVLQDLAEEIFLQEADFPATLLLGMEGLFGLAFGIPTYFCLAERFGEAPSDTFDALISSPFKAAYILFLICLFTVTGIFNISTTEVTSSMTRNVWKNFRTILVWVISLTVFYLGGNDSYGEEWITPGSFYVLGGFSVMVLGVFVYYTGDNQCILMDLWRRLRSKWIRIPVASDCISPASLNMYA